LGIRERAIPITAIYITLLAKRWGQWVKAVAWHGSYRDVRFSDSSSSQVSFTRYYDTAVGVIGHDARNRAVRLPRMSFAWKLQPTFWADRH
jgi:hypothetical protein